MTYDVVIGLEVHAQLTTRTKMFCGCPTSFGAPPNTQTCPVCQGMPGTLPVINRRAVEYGSRTALALNCRINEGCRFARKHYYYPDMPKNFQISQYEEPLAEDGWLEVDLPGGETRRIGIQRLHWKRRWQARARGHPRDGAGEPRDYNRAGVPLMKTGSRPEIRSAEEAPRTAVISRSARLSRCQRRQHGGRLAARDANISLKPPGRRELGTKVEIKNLKSFPQRAAGAEFDVKRQTDALDRGERDRAGDAALGRRAATTRSMRSKEFAHDYRISRSQTSSR